MTAPVTDSRELRCFPCCLGNHRRCYGAPCECPPHIPGPRCDAPWPPHTEGDPFQLPYAPRAAETPAPAPRVPVPPVDPPDDDHDDQEPF